MTKKKTKRDIAIEKMEAEKEILFARFNDIYKIIGKYDIKQDITQDKMIDFYKPCVMEILQYFLDEDLDNASVDVLMNMDMMMNPIRHIVSVLINSVENSREIANRKKWGKPFTSVTFQELEKEMKK